MKCVICGTETIQKVGEHEYTSLPGTTLINLTTYECPKCEESYVSIPAIEQLDRLIAVDVIRQHARLSPIEIVFLRKYLGWSAVNLAENMGVDASTVSRWEHGKQQMSTIADRLLRILVCTEKPVEDYKILDELKELASEDVKATEIPSPKWKYSRGWQAVAQ